VWITRDQKSLQWFLELLKRLEEVMDRFQEHNPDHTTQPTIYDRKKSRTPAVKIIKDSSKSKSTFCNTLHTCDIVRGIFILYSPTL
jgi:hypothetical protein